MAERFDVYMERCLYDPERGFYTAGVGVAGGRHGDFLTSPEVGPLFAEVVANALDAWWDQLGRPDPFMVYDAGTGPGSLARGLARAGGRGAAARRVVGFDLAPGGPAPDTVLPDDLAGSVVIANELLDNLPFRIVERRSDGWFEVWVDEQSTSGPVERLVPIDEAELGSAVGVDLAAAVPVGQRAPLLHRANRWVADVLARGPSVLVTLDYGAAETAALVARGGWLRTYRQHQRGDDPLLEPGSWDITTDVAVDQLPPPDEVIDQAEALRRWGIRTLVEEGRRHWAAAAAAPDLTALRMRSRVAESEALLDPAGLGSWLVSTWDRR